MNLLALPIILPFLTAVLTLFFRVPTSARRLLAILSMGFQLVVAVTILCLVYQKDNWLVLFLGNWPAPTGIVLSADYLSAILLILGAGMVLGTVVFQFASASCEEENPLQFPLTQFLMAGMAMSFLTGDIFNLFVAFEVMLMSSYGLLTLGATTERVKHALPYLVINLIGGALFLMAAAYCYGLFGTLNFAEISAKTAEMSGDPQVLVLAVFLTLVFSLKAGMFPFYYWLPKSYPHLPSPIGGLYAGMLTKVGVFALFRLFATLLPPDMTLPHTIVLVLSGPTMVVAVMGALSRGTVRQILSWHILSQVGFMLLAIGLFSVYSLAACVFYIIHHIVVKASLFLVGGIAQRLNGTDDLKKMGGLWLAHPFVGVLFLLQALSLAGIPPLSGFWGKYMILVDGMKQGEWILVFASLAASVMTLMSMVKIWLGAFWQENTGPALNTARVKSMSVVMAIFVCVSLTIGLGASSVIELSQRAAKLALNQVNYQRVINKAAWE